MTTSARSRSAKLLLATTCSDDRRRRGALKTDGARCNRARIATPDAAGANHSASLPLTTAVDPGLGPLRRSKTRTS